jgi:hypothetical protein
MPALPPVTTTTGGSPTIVDPQGEARMFAGRCRPSIGFPTRGEGQYPGAADDAGGKVILSSTPTGSP